MRKAEVQHSNSRGEVIKVCRSSVPPYTGLPLLVLEDDPWPKGTGQEAPMLLDIGTVEWLLEVLPAYRDDLIRRRDA